MCDVRDLKKKATKIHCVAGSKFQQRTPELLKRPPVIKGNKVPVWRRAHALSRDFADTEKGKTQESPALFQVSGRKYAERKLFHHLPKTHKSPALFHMYLCIKGTSLQISLPSHEYRWTLRLPRDYSRPENAAAIREQSSVPSGSPRDRPVTGGGWGRVAARSPSRLCKDGIFPSDTSREVWNVH